MRRQAPEWEEIFIRDISNKGLLLQIYKELLRINKQASSHIKKQVKDPSSYLSKED